MTAFIYFLCFLTFSMYQVVDSYTRTQLPFRSLRYSCCHANSLVRLWGKSDPTDTIPIPSIPVDITLAEALSRGIVLVAQPSEKNDFLNKAAILIYDCGTERGSTGVILEKETAFSMGESSPNCGPFEPNTVYLGGEGGSDTAMMFHKYDLQGFSKNIGAGTG
jgi:hypothetical protein